MVINIKPDKLSGIVKIKNLNQPFLKTNVLNSIKLSIILYAKQILQKTTIYLVDQVFVMDNNVR